MSKRKFKKLAALTAAATMLMSGMTVFADETYTTQTGDNLSKIAKQFYNDADKWEDIYDSNKDQIKDPNKIWANQTLLIPDLDIAQTIDTTQTTDTIQTTNVDIPAVDTTIPVNASDSSAFIQKVYALMSAQDYASMLEVDGSDEAEAYVNAMVGDRAVYTPDGSGNGAGTGVYKIPSGGYYFYYGGYAGGSRTGDGIIFMDCGSYYYLFTGAWSNDAPNGNGTETDVYLDGSYNVTTSGNLVNGLWNGGVDYKVYVSEDDYTYDLSYTAANGVAVDDLSQEYIDFSNSYDVAVSLDEGEKIIAYDINWYVEWVYDENGDEGGDSRWKSRYLSQPVGTTNGVVGFAERY